MALAQHERACSAKMWSFRGSSPPYAGTVRLLSHLHRVMLNAMLASVTAALARAMPIVRIVRPMHAFWWAKTCSTFERTPDLRPLARRVREGIIGRPCGFLRWMRLVMPWSVSHWPDPSGTRSEGCHELGHNPKDLRWRASASDHWILGAVPATGIGITERRSTGEQPVLQSDDLDASGNLAR